MKAIDEPPGSRGPHADPALISARWSASVPLFLNPDQTVNSPGLFLCSALTSQQVHVEGSDPPREERKQRMSRKGFKPSSMTSLDAWPWGRGPECARGEGWALHILKKTSWKAFELNPICVPISEIRIEVQRGSVSPLRSQWVSEGPGLHLRLLITEPHTRHSAMAAQDSGFGFQNPKQGKWVIVLSSQVIWRVGDSGVSFLLDCRSRSDL